MAPFNSFFGGVNQQPIRRFRQEQFLAEGLRSRLITMTRHLLTPGRWSLTGPILTTGSPLDRFETRGRGWEKDIEKRKRNQGMWEVLGMICWFIISSYRYVVITNLVGIFTCCYILSTVLWWYFLPFVCSRLRKGEGMVPQKVFSGSFNLIST